MPAEAIVYGTVCLDRFHTVEADGVALPGATVVELPGGEAFNTATALAGWGVRVHLTGTALGADPESDRLRHLLDTHPLGLSRDAIPELPGAVTPVCDIRVFPDGDRKMSGRGFAQALPPPPIDFAAFDVPPLLAVDPNLGNAATQAALAAADAGCRVVAMDFPIDSPVVARSAVAMTSHEHAVDPPEAHARAFVARGARVGIVTCGKDGGFVATADQKFAFPALSVRPRDTTGAGDMFRAGVCYGLVRGLSLEATIAFATAAAGLHCKVLGAASRPKPTQVRRWQRTLGTVTMGRDFRWT